MKGSGKREKSKRFHIVGLQNLNASNLGLLSV
jgi:hypothetical protein